MAIWQFQVLLVPEKWAELNQSRIANYVDDHGWDISDAWRGCGPRQFVEGLIDGYMDRGESWSAEITIWGHEERHDIQLSGDGGEIEDIQVRIDLRESPRRMIQTTVSLARRLGCSILIMEKSEVIAPSLEDLLRYASQSSAAKYVSNPRKFLTASIDQ